MHLESKKAYLWFRFDIISLSLFQTYNVQDLDQFLAEARDVQMVLARSDPTQLHFRVTGALSVGIKWSGPEADNLISV